VTTPLISPAMEDLGSRVASRMRYNASGASATVDPNANTITVARRQRGDRAGDRRLRLEQRVLRGATDLIGRVAGGWLGDVVALERRLQRKHRWHDGDGRHDGDWRRHGNRRHAGHRWHDGGRAARRRPAVRLAPAERVGGTSFSLPCASLSVTTGQIGGGQTASALTVAELTGTTDMWTDYVELSPASRIVCSYNLPAGVASSGG